MADKVELEGVLAHVAAALAAADRCNAPADIGAHLDTARCRILDLIAELPSSKRIHVWPDGFKVVS